MAKFINPTLRVVPNDDRRMALLQEVTSLPQFVELRRFVEPIYQDRNPIIHSLSNDSIRIDCRKVNLSVSVWIRDYALRVSTGLSWAGGSPDDLSEADKLIEDLRHATSFLAAVEKYLVSKGFERDHSM